MKNLFTTNPWKRLSLSHKLQDLRWNETKREKLLTKLYKIESKLELKEPKETKDYININEHKLKCVRDSIYILEQAR